jgi:outer membrane receptor protein involved in Fe transport
MHWGKRVAQAAPDQASPGGDQPTADGAPPDPPPDPPPALDPPPARAPEPEATPTPAAPVDQTPDLSDEELKKVAEQEAKAEVITVTGSTIERKTLTTPAPLTILNRDDLNASGRSTIGDILQQLPAQANAVNAQVNNGDGSTRVDIRGLGAARTLTLINGRRVVPGGTGADSSVDLNAIPLAVIERVEVLKDGASAVYGSDAIAGVVNIITRTDFAGTEASLYTGGSGKGDGFTYDASFVTGHTAENKKGNIIFSAGIQSQDPVFAGDRSYSKFDKNYNFANKMQTIGGSNSTPGGRLDATNIDIDGDGKGDVVNVCGAGVQYCTHDPGSNVYRPYDLVADLYNAQPAKYLYTPSSRYNVYSSGTYKLRPEVSSFFEATYLNRISDQQLAPELLVLGGGTFVSSKNIYNPFHGDVLTYDRRLEEFGPRRSMQNVDTFRIVGGLQGSVPEDAPALRNWKWELSYNYGRIDATQQSSGNLILSHLANAIGPSFINGNGKPRCGTPSAPIAGCVPMDVLGPSGSIDADARAYATFTGISSGYNQQQTVLATAHGRIAKLPNNGDLSLAIGTDYRKEAGGAFPDPLTVAGDTTGSASEPTEGTYNVVEGFGELSLVPISGEKYAQWVELDLAARAFRYDSFGSGLTWKAGGLFRTIDGIAMRGTYSTAFRAPSVSALFGGRFETNPAATDPCDSRPPGGGGPPVGIAAMRCKEQGVPTDAVFNRVQPR